MKVIIGNYGICYEYKENLIGWQDWYKNQKENYNK